MIYHFVEPEVSAVFWQDHLVLSGHWPVWPCKTAAFKEIQVLE